MNPTGRVLPNFNMPIRRPKSVPPPESLHAWWHPSRPGVRSGPSDFTAKLEAIDPKLAVTWDAFAERWLIWMRKPQVKHRLCPGWVLLFPVRYQDGSFMPLDERVFARLFEASADTWGNARNYFESVKREIERATEKREAKEVDLKTELAWDQMQFMKIKNIGKGNKFSNYEA